MWKVAAELTLDICAELLRDGWILKDATPLNILFQGSRPVFVDVLSVARPDLQNPIWYAYGQFVRTFLLPLLAYSELGWPLPTAMVRRDGYEPEEVGAALPWTRRLRQPALSTITLPLLFARGKSAHAAEIRTRTVAPDVGRYIIGKTVGRLLRNIRQLRFKSRPTAWSGYTEALRHYSQPDIKGKEQFVEKVLAENRPQHVLDVGCNAGVYSRLAAQSGADVVAIDTDLETVDQLFRDSQHTPYADHILPLCVDLARPTPAIGWENRENASFLERCSGRFDLVLMLAVIHHLLLGSQIPLEHIAQLCSSISKRDLVIEWVPPTDVKFKEVLRGREAIYGHLHEAAFRVAFGERFYVVEECSLANGRILFHMRRKGS